MSKKVQKNLYIPDWLANLIDAESEKGKGISEIGAAAIYAYCTSPSPIKAKMFTIFNECEAQGGKGAGFDRYIQETIGDTVEKLIDAKLEEKLTKFTQEFAAIQNSLKVADIDSKCKGKKQIG